MKFLKDKTLWPHAVSVVAMALAMFGIDIPPELQADLAVGIAAVAAVAGIVIRRFVDKS